MPKVIVVKPAGAIKRVAKEAAQSTDECMGRVREVQDAIFTHYEGRTERNACDDEELEQEKAKNGKRNPTSAWACNHKALFKETTSSVKEISTKPLKEMMKRVVLSRK
ncbi:hypothetical protein GOP47_0006166 [Adiantum capillus-veneris]|uniref:Uncharacterized protein n=1 Tax=Adiantum capillus-veneris TaxID=13818 RepID=A0A9D4V2C0_ADICA|nr:hypothetical protein GOP47_0006166 [Adiantum capillus-veneris]